jgi:hypothetical protein
MVAVLGMGGIGKTTLAARLAEEVAASFELVYWRNVGNTPSFTDWLSGAISFLSGEQQHIAQDESAELLLLLELVRRRRCLLVLDNFETLLEPNRREASFQDGYAGFGRLLHLIADGRHQSCLLLTSREMPPELESLGSGGTARALELRGLGTIDGQALLREKRLAGNADVWAALVTAYDGNGLALKIVG